MGRIESRLKDLGIGLPRVFSAPPGIEFSFDRVTVSGNLAYVSGHGPIDGTEVLVAGKVGGDVTLERGYEAARLTGSRSSPRSSVSSESSTESDAG